MRGRESPPYVFTVRDRIDVDGPEEMRVTYKLRALENFGIYVSLVLMVVYTVVIAASRLGRPDLM